MKKISSLLQTLLFVGAALFGIVQLAGAQGNTTWTGAGTDFNWSTAANWSTAGGSTPPGSADTAIFSNNAFPASTNVAGAVNNIVSASTTVGAISYLNVSPDTHTTQFPAGQTLTVNGTVTVGVASSTTVVNMVGTGNFTVNNAAGNFNVGGNGGSTETVTLTLADGTNIITAGKLSLGESASNNGRQCIMNLGAGTNIINADNVNMGTGKGSGNITWLAGTTTGGLTIRDHTGTGRATLLLANGTSGSGASKGNLLLAGHWADISAGTVTLGKLGNDTGNQTAVLTMDTGVLDATSILMGVIPATGVPSGNGAATGNTLNVGGGAGNVTLTVNSATGPGGGSFILSDSVNTSTHVASATFNLLQNAVANVNCPIVKAQATLNTATINITGGTLNMGAAANTIGVPAAPIDNFSMNGATFQFSENGSAVNASVLSLNDAGINTFNITSLPIISSLPTVIPVFTYTSASVDGNPSNLVLNPLPGSYGGYITNNGVSTISLVIISGPIFTKADEWGGNATNNWDTTSLNWTNLSALVKYAEGDSATFDDAGRTNNINVTGVRTPSGWIVTNNTLNYTFSGSGSVGGSSALVKYGVASLTLAESGGDSFGGAINVHGGTLVLDNANSALSGNLTNDVGSTVQIGNNDGNGTLPAGNVQINGMLFFNRTNNLTLAAVIAGSGTLVKGNSNTLTVTAANTYTGNTTVTGGSLVLAAAGLVASMVTTVKNSTLDVTLDYAPTFNTITLTNATLSVGPGTNFPNLSILNISNSTVSLTANYANLGGAPIMTATTLSAGGTTNLINITAIQNLPLSPALPFDLPLIGYSSATFNGGFNFGWTNLVGISGYITNNAANNSVDLVITAAPQNLVWNGGSASVNNWSDALNWTGSPITPLDALTFDGSTRTNTINDTAPATAYAGVTFNSSASPFTLSGNSINLDGTMVNNSPYNQTINLGLAVNTACTLDGGTAGGTLQVNAGVTNISASGQTVTLLDFGTINDLWATNNGAAGGGSLQFQVGAAGGEWAILDGTGAGSLIHAGSLVLGLNASSSPGTLDFGTTNSMPEVDGGTNSAVNINGTTGTFNMNNGFLAVNAMNIASSGTVNATLNVNGGALVLGPGSFTAGGGNGASVFNGVITNGAIYCTNGTFILAQRGLGTFMVNGGLLDCATLNLTTGNAAGGNGTVDLNAGTLICTNITVGSSAANGWGLVNFNGGTLKLGAGSVALFKQNNLVPLTNLVQVGGAIIDTAGFGTLFNFPLLTDPNLAGAPDGGLVKLGAGTLTLNNPGTYIGNTVVSNGTLAVNTALAATIVTVAGGTLSGNGSVGSNVTVNAGAVIAPAGGGAIGTFTIAGDLALNGTAAMELNKTAGTSDVLAVTGNLAYGGVLAVTNLAGSLTPVDTFKLFSAATYAGGFTAIAPSIPGAGLAWNTNTLTTDGTLRLVATVNTNPTNITAHVNGNTLTLSWPSDHTGWRLQAQTNSLATGLLSGGIWADIPNSTSVNSVNITINPANGTVFYRMVYP